MHNFGMCLYNKDSEYVYVPIPKNASCFLQYNFEKILGFRHDDFTNFKNLDDKKYIICLRDPIDRWVSGVSEYLHRYFINPSVNNNPIIENGYTEQEFFELLDLRVVAKIFKEKIYDEHTSHQHEFIPDVSFDNMFFLNFNDAAQGNFSDFFTTVLKKDIDNYAWKNATEEIPTKIKIMDRLNLYYVSNKKKLDNEFFEIYKQDYNLINSIAFYKSNK